MSVERKLRWHSRILAWLGFVILYLLVILPTYSVIFCICLLMLLVMWVALLVRAWGLLLLDLMMGIFAQRLTSRPAARFVQAFLILPRTFFWLLRYFNPKVWFDLSTLQTEAPYLQRRRGSLLREALRTSVITLAFWLTTLPLMALALAIFARIYWRY